MNNNEYMKVAIEEANINMKENFVNGGPFGAVIVKDGKIISRAHNTVLKSKDATAHAEVNAIREASKYLIHMIYQDVFFIQVLNLVQCVYQLLYGLI